MQTLYRTEYAKAVAGLLQGYGTPPRVLNPQNAADNLDDRWTFAIPGSPVNSTTYSITVNGVTASYTTDASATQAELEQGMLNAVRNSEVYDIAYPSLNTSSHVLTLDAREAGVELTVTASNLTATHAQTATLASEIPFGRVVGRQAGDPAGTVRLMDTTSDVPKGISLATWAIEKIGIHQDSTVAYQPGEAIDMVDRTVSNTGVWVECVETSGITEDDAVYVSVATGHKGKVTKSNSGTVAYPQAKFRSEIVLDPNGNPIVLVDVNH